MKLVSFRRGGKDGFGVVTGGGVIDLTGKPVAGNIYADPGEVFAAGAVEAVRKAADGASADFALDGIDYRLPVPRPSKIFCVGRNYRGYHEVLEDGRPDWPSIFPRYTNSFSANGQAIIRPSNDGDQLDYEGELVVVIGKRARRVAEKQAMSVVGGYTIANEGSVRNWIGRGTQNCPVKNHWRSGSIGPWLVTADEVPDPSKLHITTRVNGEVRQDGGTDMMIFDIPFVIAHISRFTELEPGDMICTGSPGGSAIEFDPPNYLKPGDTLEIEIAPIGTLTNPIAAE